MERTRDRDRAALPEPMRREVRLLGDILGDVIRGSAGPDGKLGLCEPDSTDDSIPPNLVPFGNLALPLAGKQDDLTDNIMYLNVRAGGK